MQHQPVILTRTRGPVATVWLNRPACHNALNREMILNLLETLQEIDRDPTIRIIVIRGKGASFCAGADLLMMQQAVQLSDAENVEECRLLARCFYSLFNNRKITLALVHGSVRGGAIGLLAACDLALAESDAVFAFSEVHIGIIPAVIAPYVVRKLGISYTKECMLTGRKFTAAEAESKGLVYKSVPGQEFESFAEQVIHDLLRGAPGAQQAIKDYLPAIEGKNIDEGIVGQSAQLLAQCRVMPEPQEGMLAFLEKREPSWRLDNFNVWK